METQKPRRITSTALSLMLVLSVLAVMNFTSMNALADDVPWNNGHTVSGTEWYENCTITMQGGDLTIPNGTTLVFNDSVTFIIICPEAGDYGIIIEPTGTFIVNSTSANTEIVSDPDHEGRTYPFLNSGTIGFLGANVTRVYGNSSAKNTTGGIRNLPGSTCTLEDCNIMDGDTHGIYIEGSSTLNVIDTEINTTTSVLNGTGIWIEGNSNVLLDNVTVNNTKEDGIRIIDASNVTIQGNTVINNSLWSGIYLQDSYDIVIGNGTEIQNSNSHGIYLNGSDATIWNAEIHDNVGDGILITNDSALQVEGGTIELNGRYGIECSYTKNVTIQNATISSNGEYIGIKLEYTSDSRILGCAINSHPGQAGIYCSRTESVEMIGNTITDDNIGIMLTDWSKNNVITDDNLISSNNHGIIIEGGSNNNTIKWNSLIYNGINGLMIQNANFNTIQDNAISFNGNGILLDCAIHNYILNNSISNNSANGIYLTNSFLPVGDSVSDDDYSDDTILCKLNPEYESIPLRQMAISNIESSTGGKVIKEFKNSGILELEISSGGSVEMALSTLSNNPSILYAEPDYWVTADNIPNDTYFNLLWGMNNSGLGRGTLDADIDAPEAWDIAIGNKTLVVAVIDTGIGYDHPDLNDNMWVNPNETVGDANSDGYPGIEDIDDDGDGLTDEDGEGRIPSDPGYDWSYSDDDDENGYIDDIYGMDAYNDDGDPMDDQGHGTHIAGTIGAIGNNGTGVTGVCWNASIMALKSLSSGISNSTSAAIMCIEYLLMMKATHEVNVKVISASWSSTAYSQALYDAIAACREADILFVCSAGNVGANNNNLWDGLSPRFPASFNLTNIITVAATDNRDELASFSSYGPSSVDVTAPGVNTYSTTRTYSYPKWGYGYGYKSGTSMATPHVSGLATLIASTNPTYNYLEIKNLIMNSVDQKESLSGKVVTEGRINAYNALSYIPSGLVVLAHNPGNNSALLPNVTTKVVVSISDGIYPVTDANVNVSSSSGEGPIVLLDNGIGVDQVAGDGYYSGYWTPSKYGIIELNISVSAGQQSTNKIIHVIIGGNRIYNNTILGNNNGIFIDKYSNGNLIDANNITANINGIYFKNNSGNNLILNNNISNNEYGIYVNTSSRNIIINNSASSNDYSGIYIESSNGNRIDNNTVSYNSYYGIWLENSHNNTIANNTASSNVYEGIYLYYSDSNDVTNNTAQNNAIGILIYHSDNSTISNNTIGGIDCVSNETVYVSIGGGNDPTLLYLGHGNILNCTLYIDFNGTQWYQMIEEEDYILNYETGEIDITNCGELPENWTFYAYYNYSARNEYGIWCEHSEPTIDNNFISENNQTGIYIANDLNYNQVPVIKQNQITDNLEDGIQVLDSNITVLNNTITGNTGAGIKMWNSTGEISNNSIMNNTDPIGGGGGGEMSGIDLFSCDGVEVYNNNLSYNGVNIYLEDSMNVTIEWNEIEDENAVPYSGPTPMGIYSIASQFNASNNTIWGTCFGINIEDTDDETILADNNFYRSDTLYPSTGTEIGIKLTNASLIMERNLFDGIKTGICCYDNSSAYIYDNTIINCTYDGIYLEWSEATIIENNISGNGGWGIISKYATPANAGANGADLISDNPDLGDNCEGMAVQLWQLQILVWINGTGGVSKHIMVNDTYNNTAWDGYSDGQGYATIMLAQYEIINLTTWWNYSNYSIYVDYDGEPIYYNDDGILLDENIFVTVYLD